MVCVIFFRFASQGCAGLRILFVVCNSRGGAGSAFFFCVLQLRVTLVCVFFLCAATQGHAGLRSFFACCKSGLRWSAYSHCFASQGRAGLRTYYNVGRKLVITAFNSVILIIWQL